MKNRNSKKSYEFEANIMKKERILELRSLFLKELENDFERILNYYIEWIDRDPEKFFREYWESMNSIAKCKRVRMIPLTVPLYKRDFTDEDIKGFEKDRTKTGKTN